MSYSPGQQQSMSTFQHDRTAIDNEHRADAAYLPAAWASPSNVDLIGQSILMNGFNGLKESLSCNLAESSTNVLKTKTSS